MGADTIALLSKAQMRCGGCGSKVGQQVLTRALKQVQSYVRCSRPEVLSAGDDAAVVRKSTLQPSLKIRNLTQMNK